MGQTSGIISKVVLVERLTGWFAYYSPDSLLILAGSSGERIEHNFSPSLKFLRKGPTFVIDSCPFQFDPPVKHLLTERYKSLFIGGLGICVLYFTQNFSESLPQRLPGFRVLSQPFTACRSLCLTPTIRGLHQRPTLWKCLDNTGIQWGSF